MPIETSQFSPTNPKKDHKLKTLFFLEVGLFEVGFVALLLFIIFGLLVFFRIIDPSKTFLSHVFPSKNIPVPSIQQPDDFSHTANNFLQKNLATKYVPLEKQYRKESAKDSTFYTLPLTQPDFTGKFIYRIHNATHELDKMSISGTIIKPKDITTLSSDNAAKIIKAYTPLPADLKLNCNLLNENPENSSMCFIAYRSNNLTIGYELISPNAKDYLLLYICAAPYPPDAGTTDSCRRM